MCTFNQYEQNAERVVREYYPEATLEKVVKDIPFGYITSDEIKCKYVTYYIKVRNYNFERATTKGGAWGLAYRKVTEDNKMNEKSKKFSDRWLGKYVICTKRNIEGLVIEAEYPSSQLFAENEYHLLLETDNGNTYIFDIKHVRTKRR